jgi:hypothetical protein
MERLSQAAETRLFGKAVSPLAKKGKPKKEKQPKNDSPFSVLAKWEWRIVRRLNGLPEHSSQMICEPA